MKNINKININSIDNTIIKNFLKDKKLIIQGENSNNIFLIGNKNNKIIIFNYDIKKDEITIDSFKFGLINKLIKGFFIKSKIKKESFIDFKNNYSYNKNEGLSILKDNNIDFSHNIDSYGKYFSTILSNKIPHYEDKK